MPNGNNAVSLNEGSLELRITVIDVVGGYARYSDSDHLNFVTLARPIALLSESRLTSKNGSVVKFLRVLQLQASCTK